MSGTGSGTGAAPRSARSPAADASGAGSAAADDIPGARPSSPGNAPSAAPSTAGRGGGEGGSGLLWSLLSTPLSWLAWGLQGTLSASLGILFFPLRLLRAPNQPNPQREAEAFVTAFRSRYGASAPPFMECDFATAKARARDQNRFLLIYLHSDKHADSDAFCSCVPPTPRPWRSQD